MFFDRMFSSEVLKLRAMLAVVLLFVVSAWLSWQSLRYAIWSTRIVAEVVRVDPVLGRYGRQRETAVTYRFLDDRAPGGTRTEKDYVSRSWSPPQAEGNDEESGESSQSGARPSVVVEFIPGVLDSSRLPRAGQWIWITIFGVMFAAVSIVSVLFWRDFQRHQRRLAMHR